MNPIQPTTSKCHKFTAWLNHNVLLILLGATISLALGGCGAELAPGSSADDSASNAASASAPEDTSANSTSSSSAAPGAASAKLIQAASAVPRKIIYNATVDLITDNFGGTQSAFLALIQKHQGYLAETNVNSTPGSPRQGTWKVRIPEGHFAAFMASVVKLGELQTTHTDSQDVTAQFYDLQARISNQQVEEQRLLDHLRHSTSKLSDILQIEHEITRVRGEIEEMQGQLRLMANMTSLTTITVTLREVKGYVPAKPTTFGTQVVRSFQSSLALLLDFGKNAVLVVVAVAPWLLLFAIIGIPLWRLQRRAALKSSTQSNPDKPTL